MKSTSTSRIQTSDKDINKGLNYQEVVSYE